MGKFAGKWVAIDTKKDKIIAVSDTPEGIKPFVTRSINDKTPDEEIPTAFKVPYKNEKHVLPSIFDTVPVNV